MNVSSSGSRSVARASGSALAIVVPVVIVAGMFLTLYVARDERFPAGYDTPKYIWRANLVEAEGPRALAGSVQPPLHANARSMPTVAATRSHGFESSRRSRVAASAGGAGPAGATSVMAMR